MRLFGFDEGVGMVLAGVGGCGIWLIKGLVTGFLGMETRAAAARILILADDCDCQLCPLKQACRGLRKIGRTDQAEAEAAVYRHR